MYLIRSGEAHVLLDPRALPGSAGSADPRELLPLRTARAGDVLGAESLPGNAGAYTAVAVTELRAHAISKRDLIKYYPPSLLAAVCATAQQSHHALSARVRPAVAPERGGKGVLLSLRAILFLRR